MSKQKYARVAIPERPRDIPWITRIYRTGQANRSDIEYAARKFPAAVIDAHTFWHSAPGGPDEDFATCGADLCVQARSANPLLGLVVANEESPYRPPVPRWLTNCVNDQTQLETVGHDLRCPTCGYEITNGALAEPQTVAGEAAPSPKNLIASGDANPKRPPGHRG